MNKLLNLEQIKSNKKNFGLTRSSKKICVLCPVGRYRPRSNFAPTSTVRLNGETKTNAAWQAFITRIKVFLGDVTNRHLLPIHEIQLCLKKLGDDIDLEDTGRVKKLWKEKLNTPMG